MAFTVNKRLSAQAAASASGTWGAGGTTGVDLNTGVIGPLDTMLAGVSTISTSSGTYSLTFTAGGGGDVSNALWRFTASPLLGNLTVSPTAGDATTYLNGFYYFENLTTGSFTITLVTAAGSVTLPQTRRGVLFVDSVNGPRIISAVGTVGADDFPVGTSTLFVNTTVPTGWTKGSTYNNHTIRLSTSTGNFTAGSVDFTTLFGRTGTDAVTLTAANLPANATYDKPTIGGTQAQQATGSPVGYPNSVTTFTATALAGAAGSSFTPAIDMQLKYVGVLIGTRV